MNSASNSKHRYPSDVSSRKSMLISMYFGCFRGTLVLFIGYSCFVLAAVAGLVDRNGDAFVLITYASGILLLTCIVTMATYALLRIRELWVKGDRNAALFMLLALLALSGIAGYYWFYKAEIKKTQDWF